MSDVKFYDQYVNRHNGPDEAEMEEMLKVIGVDSLDQLIDETVPASIRMQRELRVPEAISEFEYLQQLREVAAKNTVNKSYIGLGYYNTITPSVIKRTIFENPGWYTSYTPYQAEIAQGRLEALLNFQTMVTELTGLPIANASLLDEATSAAEAMTMFFGAKNKRKKDNPINKFFVSDKVFPQTIDVLKTRAQPLDIEVIVTDTESFDLDDHTFGILLQYPASDGAIEDYRALAQRAKEKDIYVTVSADLLSLTLLTPPGEWGADAVVGNTQRFGIPMGYGGPHAAFFATTDSFKRNIPGRIIGVSVDAQGQQGYRMALQTREQHIRREKATSNICTAQALLAIMAGMYATYHGPQGLKEIAKRVHKHTAQLAEHLLKLGYEIDNNHYFDTIEVPASDALRGTVRQLALDHGMNFHYTTRGVQISLDETTLPADINDIVRVFGLAKGTEMAFDQSIEASSHLPAKLLRESDFLTHPVFNSFHTETKMMRYIKRLEKKDLSLTHSMIALGSCTMKLNAATTLIPVGWEEFANIHPFAPLSQVEGYKQIFQELEEWLCDITDYAACSLQPNSGAQGEYAGLLTIRAYHIANGDKHRNIALIPSSAHGTNPASAVMAGMKVVVVKCDEQGNIDLEDLREKAEKHKDQLSSLMVTYPSTHGVFEAEIREICKIVHDNGGKVYMDGANMNAQVGLTAPNLIGADVCHLNLHKTFAIPHGGGGPGMGPILVNESLAPFLPKHPLVQTGGSQGISAVAAAPWGSASILLISHAYIRMLGRDGLTEATKVAILNANYIKARVEKAYNVLYVGEKGHSAHELILDLRPFKAVAGAEDVAKRLIDCGFHAPTLSWPVANTFMVEPTESEGKEELDRFCDALLQIRQEIDEVAKGEANPESNVLHNAPHTIELLSADEWPYDYSRQKAAYPLEYLQQGHKFWAPVARIDNAYGDRNLVCTCPPLEAYEA